MIRFLIIAMLCCSSAYGQMLQANNNDVHHSGIVNVAIVNVTINATSAPTGINVTDNAGNSYTLLSSIGSATNTQWVGQWCGVQNNPAQVFTVGATTNLVGRYVKGTVTEFSNIATGAGGCASADQNWTNDATTTSATVCAGTGNSTCTTGTKAPTVSGDMIHMFVANDAGTVETSFTAGTGQSNITWNLVQGSGNVWEGIPQQWGVYSSTTAFNPKMTWSTSGTYVASAIALKAAVGTPTLIQHSDESYTWDYTDGANSSAVLYKYQMTLPQPTDVGTAIPAGMWISGIQHSAIFSGIANGSGAGPQNQTSPVKFQFPTVGNMAVVSFTGDFNGQPTAISSSVGGETWSQARLVNDDANAGFAAIWYACNIAASQPRILTITLNQNVPANSGMTAVFYDVSNALASASCQDTGSTTTGTGATTSFSHTVGAFGASNELFVSVTSLQASGAKVSAQTSGVNFNNGGFTLSTGTPENQCGSNISPPQPLDECNGMYSGIAPTTSSISITTNRVTDGSASQNIGEWCEAWEAFKHP